MPDGDAEGTGGRRSRRSAQELRDDLLQVALDVLISEGLEAGVGSVTLERVVREANAPRSSAYRLWQEADRSPQDAFRSDLLCTLVRNAAEGVDFDAVVTAVGGVLDAHRATMNDDDESMTRCLRAVIRAAGNLNWERIVTRQGWRIWLATSGAISTVSADVDPEVRQALLDGETASVERLQDLYSNLAPMFGLRLCPEYTWAQFTSMTTSLLEGMAIREPVNPHLRGITRPTGDGGTDEEWTLFACGFEAVVRQCLEADPDAPVSADLAAH